MAKNRKNAMVEVPALTLNALKGLLFNSNSGTDLSAIIDDLSVNEDTRDLLAINVGLVFKGLKPEIDTTTRYERDWNHDYYKYIYRGYSLITGDVKVVRVSGTVLEDGTTQEKELPEHPDIMGVSYTQWLEMTTDLQTVIAKIKPAAK